MFVLRFSKKYFWTQSKITNKDSLCLVSALCSSVCSSSMYSMRILWFFAMNFIASPKERFSFSMIKVMASPPRLQLKQWKRFLWAVTENEAVRSEWKGHKPINVKPFFESSTYGLRTFSMGRFLTLFIVDSLIITYSQCPSNQ